ncbi:hypothetical protein [Amycolatopsis pigmentata]|uniref:Uncharacterized protein n=1 Tax=Amycolatopsis pigmentata TaxID=450801 RepID=A0ABW5G160_9PSEU
MSERGLDALTGHNVLPVAPDHDENLHLLRTPRDPFKQAGVKIGFGTDLLGAHHDLVQPA